MVLLADVIGDVPGGPSNLGSPGAGHRLDSCRPLLPHLELLVYFVGNKNSFATPLARQMTLATQFAVRSWMF